MTTRVPQILLVRHCESSGQGPDVPLTERGRAQAVALADDLAASAIDHIVCSPYLRAHTTIAPFEARSGLPVHIDDRLVERQISPEPIPHWRDVVRQSFVDLEHRVPGGESGREALSRGWAAIRDVLGARHRLAVVVSHGQLLSLVFHSIDPRFGYAGWESLTTPDVYLMEENGEGDCTFRRTWDVARNRQT